MSFMGALSGRDAPSPHIGRLRRMLLSYPALTSVREMTGPAQETRALAGQVEALRAGSADTLRRTRERIASARLGPGYAAQIERTAGFDLARATGAAEREAKARTAFSAADIQQRVLQSLTDLSTLHYLSRLRKFEMQHAAAGQAVSTASNLVTGIVGSIWGGKAGGRAA